MARRGDQELVRLARAGDSRAAQELFSGHLRQAWAAGFAVARCPHVADDALQDGVERAIRHLDRFDDARPFAPWFTRIVVNRSLEILRRSRRREEQPLDEVPEHRLASGDDMSRRLEMEGAIEALTPEQRAAVVMRLVLGFGADETAKAMGVPAGTVHSRLSRALGNLRANLAGEA